MAEGSQNPSNTGRSDILNNVDMTESLEVHVDSLRGTDRKEHGNFLAIQNFFERDEDIKGLWERDVDYIKPIANEISMWNEEKTNFDINWNDYSFHAEEANEADSRDNPKPVHNIHTQNIHKECYKWSAIVNCSSRDDVQGGELIFPDWKPPMRRDNYGKPIGDSNSQPTWINEMGTLIILPSIAAAGYQLVVSGGFRRVHLHFRGPSYR